MAKIFDFGFKEYKIKMDGSYFMGGYFAVMGDTARRVEVRLLGTDNVVRDASGLRLQLWADAGGKVSYAEGEAVEPEKGRYRFDLINGLLLSPGVQKFQWRIIDSDGRKINSIQFNGRIGNDLEGDAWEDVHQLYLNTGQLKKEVDEVRKLQDDLIDGAVDSAAVQQHVEERYANLEAEYAEDLSTLKRNDENLTAQLVQKISKGEVSVNDINKNKGKFDATYFAEEFLEDLSNGEINTTYLDNGSVTTSKLADDAVSPEKTTFFEFSDEDTGGFSKDGYIAISSHPEHQGNHIYSEGTGSVRFIKIEPNKTYKITPYGGDRHRYALATTLLEPKGHVDLRPEMIVLFEEDGNAAPFTFTGNEDSQYLIVYLSSKGEDVPFKLEKMYMSKGLIPERGVGNNEILDKSVSPEKTTFFEFSDKNLLYGSFYKDGYIAYRDPEAWGSESHTLRQQDDDTPNARVHFIPIEPDTMYTLTISGKSNRNRYALATSDLGTTSGAFDLYPKLELIFNDDGNDSPFTFTSKPDSSYLVLYLHTEGYEVPVQLEKGDIATEYEQPAQIKTELIPTEIKESNNVAIVTRKYDFFYKSESIPDMRSSLETTKKDFVYGLYDDLADKYPELVSKETLGYGYNTSGEIDESFPIYEYTFSPAQTLQMSQDGQSTLLTMPKPMLLTSGVHGDEKAAVYGLYEMFKQMIENPQRNYRVDNLKNSYVFKVIPLVSPGGYDRNTRNNPIGVNINRDFTSLQAVETQIVVDWWQENADAFGYFDVHNFWRNFGGRTPTSTSYHMSANPEVDEVYSKFIRNASDDWYYNYMEGYQDKGKIAYGFNQSNVYRELDTSNNAAYHDYGFEISGLIESARQDPDQISVQNTSATLELSVEVFINYFLAIHDRFGD